MRTVTRVARALASPWIVSWQRVKENPAERLLLVPFLVIVAVIVVLWRGGVEDPNALGRAAVMLSCGALIAVTFVAVYTFEANARVSEQRQRLLDRVAGIEALLRELVDVTRQRKADGEDERR
jgi:hypothetical protein